MQSGGAAVLGMACTHGGMRLTRAHSTWWHNLPAPAMDVGAALAWLLRPMRASPPSGRAVVDARCGSGR
eukprot:2690138-Prymnesium_polylepis.2